MLDVEERKEKLRRENILGLVTAGGISSSQRFISHCGQSVLVFFAKRRMAGSRWPPVERLPGADTGEVHLVRICCLFGAREITENTSLTVVG